MLQLDFHIALTLFQRGWAIIAGGVTVVFMPLCLTPVEQGYYFTFLSLMALQVFFELGFNSVIVQLVGHEVAHLQIDEAGLLKGDPARTSRLASLLVLLKQWYITAAVSFFAVVSFGGYFFIRLRNGLPVTQWLAVWIALVFFTSINLYLSPQLAMFEGIGRVGQVARLRLVQSIIGFSIMWFALAHGAGLNAVVVLPAIGAITSFGWLFFRRSFLSSVCTPHETDDHRMRWRTEILPLQWRIAVSWISGYCVFQAFTPMVFVHQGAVEAGRLGIALTIFTSISALGMSWVNASAPKMAQLIARGERSQLNKIFLGSLRSSMAFTLLASVSFLLFVEVLRFFRIPAVGRIASLPILECLSLVAVANSFISSAAVYMRAHKVEPMLAPSIVGGITTLLSVYFGSTISSLVPIVLWSILTIFLGVPWTIRLLIPFYRLPGPQMDARH